MFQPRRSSRLQQKQVKTNIRERPTQRSTGRNGTNKVGPPLHGAIAKILAPRSFDDAVRIPTQQLTEGKSRKRKRVKESPAEPENQVRSCDVNSKKRCTIPAVDKESRQQQSQQQQQKQEEEEAQQGEEQALDPVAHWATHGSWPAQFGKMTGSRGSTPQKRQRTSSYTQSVKNGEVPQAHSAPAVEQLLLHGINLEATSAKQYISQQSKTLLSNMTSKTHDYTPNMSYPLEKLDLVMDRISLRNEARLIRDLSPLLVPSPESLVFSDVLGFDEAKGIIEDIAADWKKVHTMAGPTPRPDFTVGVGRAAFDSGELRKLQNHMNWNRPTLFTDWVYFPFLICEVKCSDQPISKGARQSGHASGLAANAIFELYHSLGHEEAKALNGHILVFSIVHDHQSAQVYGFFPFLHTAESRPTFYRYLVREVMFGEDAAQSTKRIRDLVIEIYSSFFPLHLKRIKDFLEKIALPAILPAGQELPDDSESMPPPTLSASQARIQQVEQESQARIQQVEQESEARHQQFQQESEARHQQFQQESEARHQQFKRDLEQQQTLANERFQQQAEFQAQLLKQIEESNRRNKQLEEQQQQLIAKLLDLPSNATKT